MKKLVFIFLIYSPILFVGQTFQWVKYDKGTNQTQSLVVDRDKNDNALIAGNFNHPIMTLGTYSLNNAGDYDVFIAKYDKNGNILWATSLAGINGDYCSSISVDPNGNTLIAGIFQSPKLIIGTYTLNNLVNSNYDIFMAKFDPNGTAIWAKNFGGQYSHTAIDIDTDSQGNVTLAGAVGGGTLTIDTFKLYFPSYLVKFDPNGNAIWAVNPKSTSGGGIGAISTDSLGNTSITGTYSGTMAIQSTTVSSGSSAGRIFTARFNYNGNLSWITSSGGSLGTNGDGGASASIDPNGNTYVTGRYDSPVLTFGSYTLTNNQCFSPFIVKYDSLGNVLWAKNGHGPNTCTNNLGLCVSSDKNSVIMTGAFTNTFIVFGNDTLKSNSFDPMYIVKYDGNGNRICLTKLESGSAAGNSVCLTSMGDAYIASSFYSYVTPFIVGGDTIVPTGLRNTFLTKFTCSTTGIEEFQSTSQLNLFPNPNNGIFKILIDNRTENTEVIIVNSIGQQVKCEKLTSSKQEIDISNLPSGIYFVKIGLVTRKIIKE